jgi:hypothetical protein
MDGFVLELISYICLQAKAKADLITKIIEDWKISARQIELVQYQLACNISTINLWESKCKGIQTLLEEIPYLRRVYSSCL